MPGQRQSRGPFQRRLDPDAGRNLSHAGQDAAAYDAGLNPLEDQIGKRRYSEYIARTDQKKLLNQSFDDPARENYYRSLYDSSLQQGLGQAYDTANHQNRAATFNAADRGVLGGSSDVNKRAGVGRALDYASLGAENTAFNFADQYRRGDEDKRVNLMRLIESGDPASQAAIAQQLHGITDNTQQGLVQQYLQQQSDRQKQASQNANSQLIGNALAWGGTQYSIDQNARAYGGQGLGWMPQFGYTNNSGNRSD